MSDYAVKMESDKKIVPCGTGYVVRITKEIALMGLNPGDVVHVQLTRISKKEEDETDGTQP